MSDYLTSIVNKLTKTYKNVHIAKDNTENIKFISTGSKAFDLMLDGGIPWGYVSELSGLSQSGKSLFVQMLIANAQKDYNGIGILVDRENAYTPNRGTALGIDNDRLLIAKPSDTPTPIVAFQFIIDSITGIREQEIAQKKKDEKAGKKIKEKVYILIAIDSIAAFGKDTTLDKADMGRKAKSVHEGLRELIPHLDEHMSLVVANQITYKIGIMFGDPKTTTSGESMKYYSNVRLNLEEFKRIIDSDRGNEVLGNWIRIQVEKTRLGPCYRQCFVRHLYKTGVDVYSGYARFLADKNYIKPKNKEEFLKFKQVSFKYKGKTFSTENTADFLKQYSELDFNTFPEWCENPQFEEEEKPKKSKKKVNKEKE